MFFWIILVNVVCVCLMVMPGLWAGRSGRISNAAAGDLSRLMVWFIYPALVFSSIYSSYDVKGLLENWALPAASFLIMLVGSLIGWAVTKVVHFSSGEERKAFVFQTTMNNYSFLPLPLVMALWGQNGVAALILSSLGGELAGWTLGVFVLSGGKLDPRNLRHLYSPPLMAIYLAVLARGATDFFGCSEWVLNPRNGNAVQTFLKSLGIFGAATVPLAMTIAGCRIGALRPKGLTSWRVWLLTGVRMIVIPFAAIGMLYLLPLSASGRNVMIVVATMPVALASFMFSEFYGGDKDFITCTAIVTHLAALITVPVLLSVLL